MTDRVRRSTRVLLVEETPEDLGNFREAFSRLDDGYYQVWWVGKLSRAFHRLSLGGVDVVLLDLELPDSRGLTTFERANAFVPNVPIVVLATVHANDAVSAVARLADLGLQHSTIGSALRGALVQRLLRKVYAACAEPVCGVLTPEEQRLTEHYETETVIRAVGYARVRIQRLQGADPGPGGDDRGSEDPTGDRA